MGLDREISKSPRTVPAVVTLAATTATQLTATHTLGARGVLITADPGNSAAVFIGASADVTDAAAWMAWVKASVGTSVLVPVADASSIYVYTTGTGQKIGWAVV